MARSELILPPGFRFHPTDEELVIHYLCNKCVSNPVPVSIIKELDLYKYDPWQLPELALYGEKEWYFFSSRDRKYPNGSRPNRAAGTGYWKATGADKPIGRPKTRGIKKALVFYAGKAPKGVKTNWIMHEYRLANVDRSARKKNSDYLRLDDWVLCRLYNKKGRIEKHSSSGEEVEKFPKAYEEKPKIPMPVQNNEVMNNQLGVETLDWLHSGSSDSEYVTSDIMTPDNQLDIDTSDWFHAGTSDSEHVTSSNVTCEREVQSGADWSMLEKRQLEEQNEFDLQLDFMNGFSDDPFGIIGPQAQFQMDQVSSFQDMYLYLQKT